MIFLKKMREEDLELVLKWKKAERSLNREHNLTMESQKRWFCNIEKNDRCSYWIINSGPIKIGIADITYVDSDKKSCGLECIIEDKHFLNRGIAEIVLFNLLEYAYNNINMEKAYISIWKNNNSINEDELINSFADENIRLDNVSEEFFGHKCICIRKVDWQSNRNRYLSERITIE